MAADTSNEQALNTRDFLQPYVNAKVSLEGTFERLSVSEGYKGTTVLLVEVTITTLDKKVFHESHVWVQRAYDFQKMECLRGDKVSCSARVTSYNKLHEGNSLTSYGVSTPSDLQIIDKMPRPKPEIKEMPDAGANASPDGKRESPIASNFQTLHQLATAVKEMGGTGAVREILAKTELLYELVSGPDELFQCLELLDTLKSL